MIKIISNGLGRNTQIFNSDSKPIEGVTKIEFEPITCKSEVVVKLAFESVELEIQANWSAHTIETMG